MIDFHREPRLREERTMLYIFYVGSGGAHYLLDYNEAGFLLKCFFLFLVLQPVTTDKGTLGMALNDHCYGNIYPWSVEPMSETLSELLRSFLLKDVRAAVHQKRLTS